IARFRTMNEARTYGENGLLCFGTWAAASFCWGAEFSDTSSCLQFSEQGSFPFDNDNCFDLIHSLPTCATEKLYQHLKSRQSGSFDLGRSPSTLYFSS